MNMNDDEYKKFLNGIAAKYLRPQKLSLKETESLREDLDRLTWLSKLNHVAQDDQARGELDDRLRNEIRNAPLKSVADSMAQIGMLDALDDAQRDIFCNLRASVIPEEDLRLLRQAGFADPEVEVAQFVGYARTQLAHVGGPQRPSEIVFRASDELARSAEYLGPKGPRKKRKIFTGIGKILGGAIAGAGNVLIACGTILAPNSAVIYTALGSAAIAVAGIGQGIGDLRGE